MKISTVILLTVCFAIGGIALWLYFQNFNGAISSDDEHWSRFGGYISGTIGSIVGLASIVLLYETLKSQREASLIQSFEPSFFNMLSIQRDILKELSGQVYPFLENQRSDTNTYKGHDYMDKVKDAISNLVSQKVKNEAEYCAVKTQQEIIAEAGAIYMRVFEGKESQLGHYFRHLYYIIRYVDESKVEEKKRYIDILQAQMSDSELFVGFYSGFSNLAYEKFTPLADDYKLFRNVRGKSIPDCHKKIYKKTIFDNNAV